MKRRLLSIFLSLTMILSMVPSVWAADETQQDDTDDTAAQETGTPAKPAMNGDCGAEGADVQWSFNSNTGVLTISGNGAMADYAIITENKVMHTTAPWKAYDSDIKSVIIEPGVTKIGSHAFFMCNNLESVSIPEGVTTIEDRAFWQTSLKNITIPASVTQIGSTIKEVFYQCYDLESITVANGNTAYRSVDGVLYTADGTTLIQYPQNKADTSYKMIDEAKKIDFLAFNYTQNLQTIDFNNVTEFANKAVYGNQALQEIVLKNAASLGDQAFSGNKEVTSVLLEKAPTTVGESVFSSCTSLANVTLPDDMKNLQDGMFAFCTALKTLKFPAQLNRIGKACFDKAGLTGDLVIPASVTSIGNLAFRNCFGLTSITVEGTPTFESQGYAFQFCKNLLWMKASFNITKYFGGLGTADEYQGFEKQNSAWFTSEGTQVSSNTDINKETVFYRWFVKKIPLNLNGGQNNGNIKEVYAFFAPALENGKTISLPKTYYVGQTNYINTVKSADITRDGYTFKEWTSDAAGEKPYEIGKYIYNYMPEELYAQWNKVIAEDIYFVSPTIADQTYTGSALEPVVKVTKNGEEITEGFRVEYDKNTNVGTATATVKVGDTVIGTATFNIVKATPSISISAAPDTLTGSGTVKLTVTGAPTTEGSVTVTCDNDITVTKNEDDTYSAALPNATKTYTFKASYTGAENGNYSDKDAKCTVTVTRRSSGSGSSYAVSAPSSVKNGSVTVSPKSASKGDTVTVTVKPDSGYVLETLTVTDKNGNELTLKDKGNGKYTFTMPSGKVEVKATFMEDNSMLNFFYDVPNGAYFYDAVKWAVENGITTGVGNDLFAPEQPCTRSQIVTFLWRAAGSPEPKSASSFADVSADSYYAKAVAWAVENGITTGTGADKFSPDAVCTRAQAVTFLARALNGKAAGGAKFTDVPADSYFADAVAWALSNGVTGGIGDGLFGADNDCTRAQIVTFLFRAYNK